MWDWHTAARAGAHARKGDRYTGRRNGRRALSPPHVPLHCRSRPLTPQTDTQLQSIQCEGASWDPSPLAAYQSAPAKVGVRNKKPPPLFAKSILSSSLLPPRLQQPLSNQPTHPHKNNTVGELGAAVGSQRQGRQHFTKGKHIE